jgi:hypothetical protein
MSLILSGCVGILEDNLKKIKSLRVSHKVCCANYVKNNEAISLN